MNEYQVLIAHEVDGEIVETVGEVKMAKEPNEGETVTVSLGDENGAPIKQTGTVVAVL